MLSSSEAETRSREAGLCSWRCSTAVHNYFLISSSPCAITSTTSAPPGKFSPQPRSSPIKSYPNRRYSKVVPLVPHEAVATSRLLSSLLVASPASTCFTHRPGNISRLKKKNTLSTPATFIYLMIDASLFILSCSLTQIFLDRLVGHMCFIF